MVVLPDKKQAAQNLDEKQSMERVTEECGVGRFSFG